MIPKSVLEDAYEYMKRFEVEETVEGFKLHYRDVWCDAYRVIKYKSRKSMIRYIISEMASVATRGSLWEREYKKAFGNRHVVDANDPAVEAVEQKWDSIHGELLTLLKQSVYY